MAAPPGVLFWAQKLPQAIAPPIVLYALLHVPAQQNVLALWVRALAYLLVAPLYFYCKSIWTLMKHRRRAWKRGAKLFPIHHGSLPLDVDLLHQALQALPHEYAVDFIGSAFAPNSRTFTLNILGETRVFTTEPRYIKHILTRNFSNYVKGQQLFGAATRSVLGTGVFNADGDLWKFHRALARPFFNRDRISDFQIFLRHADDIIDKMKENFRSGRPVDAQDMYARFTLDSATEFLFGACVNSIHEPLLLPGGIEPPLSGSVTPGEHPRVSSFIRSFGAAQEVLCRRLRTGFTWPAFETFKDQTAEHCENIRAYLQPLVEMGLERRRQLPGDENVEAGEAVILLDHLVLETDDVDVIRDSLINMLIAGRDTAKDEVLRVVGSSRAPTYDDIRELKFMRAVLNETLRLWPPVPLNYRETIEEDLWTAADGSKYYIPPKTATSYSVMHMHRDKDIWGPDALEFDPMRWIDERLALLTANPFAFLAFNAGPRICLGQQFAYNEASFLLVRLLQTFSSIQLRPDAQPAGTLPNPQGKWDLSRGRNAKEKVWPRTHLTMYVQGGLWLSMQEAEKEAEGDSKLLNLSDDHRPM